jgi:hypothetical protein
LFAIVVLVSEGRAFRAVVGRVERKAFLVLEFRDIDKEGLAWGPGEAAEGVAEVDGAVKGA